MLVGNKQRFAVELEILDEIDGWVFGTFIFWIQGIAIGDPEDNAVDLKGCINWLRGYLENPSNRVDPELYVLNKDTAYSRLCDSVLAGGGNQVLKEEFLQFYSRFHISHIGMSSFDSVTIVLLENGQGGARCIWKQGSQEAQDAFLDIGEINQVFKEVIEWWKNYRSSSSLM